MSYQIMRDMDNIQLKNLMDEIDDLNEKIDQMEANVFPHPYNEDERRQLLEYLDKVEREKDKIERRLIDGTKRKAKHKQG